MPSDIYGLKSLKELYASNNQISVLPEEISKLKPQEYLKHEKDIDLARAEGRIRN